MSHFEFFVENVVSSNCSKFSRQKFYYLMESHLTN